ncbi:MAG: glutathione S-transferase [Pseudomonadota bacterium]
MSELILHEYPASPFSEKIRALFGYKQLAYRSVEIPVIMPKPDLTALTGGYRKTPVMQVGADIYCDTALIAQVIEDTKTSPAVLDETRGAVAVAAARWTDSDFFRVCVGMVFKPKAVASNPRFQDPAVVEAFLKDRAALTAGAPNLAMPEARAEAAFLEHLERMDKTLSALPYLGGDSPSILDFSTWHCLWFVYAQPVLREYFSSASAVQIWMKRMAEFSQRGESISLSGEEAIEIAGNSEPQGFDAAEIDHASGLSVDQTVAVMPTDYGFQPVTGTLQRLTEDVITIARNDDRAGRLHVHFPRYGFEVSPEGIDS